MKLLPLQIGDLKVKIPIIQGGMGIGVSLSKLASAVANEGGIGVISGAQIGFKEADFQSNSKEANIRVLKREIKEAKRLSHDGAIGVNLMVAMSNYDDMVKASVEAGVDIIISGAGLPSHLPKFTKGSSTKIAPIVSSGKAARVMCKLWDDRYDYIPDFIVVEGPEAGGHLGFSLNELNEGVSLEDRIAEVIDAVKPFESKYGKKIPIIAAGGIYTGEDIAKFIKLGAAGVQMATRFVATEECDADINFKKAYLNCKKEDIKIVKSPVGMPGRAIRNKFIDSIQNKNSKIDVCYKCLKKCNPEKIPYCITKALIESVEGNTENGLVFTGSNAYRINKIVTVKELIKELVEGVYKYD